MRVTIITVGSRGDLQPYLALGLGLAGAGYHVTLATHRVFEPLVRGRGLDFAAVEINPRELLRGEAGQAWLASGRNPVTFARRFVAIYTPLIERVLAESWAACQGTEAIVYSPLAMAGPHIAERLGVPCVLASLQPKRPSRHLPPMLFPQWSLGTVYNRASHSLVRALGRVMIRPLLAAINNFRTATLGLPALTAGQLLARHERIPVLNGVSPSVCPPPPDWPAWVHTTGYWFLARPDDWAPPPELVDFLGAGPAPVYVGFGSMAGPDPVATTRLVVAALAASGQRGVLLTGWGGLDRAAMTEVAGELGAELFAVDDIPHDWLFPRMAAVFHHGGAGTTAAGLRAGVPSAALPFFGDQPYWGGLLARLGVGPKPIPQRQLTAQRLAVVIRQAVADPSMRARAADMGRRIRAEDGVAGAVAAFHEHATAPAAAMAAVRDTLDTSRVAVSTA